MAKSGVIAEYVERLGRELAFDPSLSRRVRREVEDHLWEVVSADPTPDRLEAERRAVSNFGDPGTIAAQFAVVSATTQARRVGAAAILVIAVVFLAMKARLTWYAVTGYPADSLGSFGEVVLSIDRYAFWLSVVVGIAGFAYIGRLPLPAAFTPAYRTQLRRFSYLCLAAAGALSASVIADGVITSLRLSGTRWSVDVWMPLVSMVIEVVCAGGFSRRSVR